MINDLRELCRYRELLAVMVWRDIKVKYKQSVMGFLWALLMPLIIVSAGILVKYAIAAVSGSGVRTSQLLTVSVKAVPWAFIVSSIRFATTSLVQNTNLVTKIYFPREIFPIAAVLSNFVDFLTATCVLVFILLLFQSGVSVHLWYVPVLILLIVSFVTGMGLILAALNLFFRDVRYLVEVVLTFAIFFTPVLYEVTMFGKLAKYLLMNPVAPLLEALNSCVVLHETPQLGWVAYSGAFSVLMLVGGYRLFKRLEPKFAESI